jgi:hypothetical protein
MFGQAETIPGSEYVFKSSRMLDKVAVPGLALAFEIPLERLTSSSIPDSRSIVEDDLRMREVLDADSRR